MRKLACLPALVFALVLVSACPDGDPEVPVGGSSGIGGAGVGGMGHGGGGQGGSPVVVAACGFGSRCALTGEDPFAWCDSHICGPSNTVFGLCFSDGNYLCECRSGACSRESCVETSTCDKGGPAANEVCELEAAELCAGESQVRFSLCEDFIEGPRCEVVCKTGGSRACD